MCLRDERLSPFAAALPKTLRGSRSVLSDLRQVLIDGGSVDLSHRLLAACHEDFCHDNRKR